MSTEAKNSKDVVVAETIFTPVMDVKSATQGFKEFQRLKHEILDESDIVMIMGKPHVKKSGWNKLALFFGTSTRTVSSKKVHNPDGSYEWEVTVEAYKKDKDGAELYNVQRSALVSSLEKEQSQGQKNSPRKSHDVFASAETRAEGRALAAFFGTGEVSAEEIGDDSSTPTQTKSTETIGTVSFCQCGDKCQPSDEVINEKQTDKKSLHGLLSCKRCSRPISQIRTQTILSQRQTAS